MSEPLVFATIAAATLAWAYGEVARSRWAWAAGAALATVHSLAAFAVFHRWSHGDALAATARQTAAVVGWAWGGGLYFNYAFLLVWLADAAWWIASPRSHAQRPRAVDGFVRGFLFFMFVNGAVVFADGGMRVLGILAVGTVSTAWLIRSFRQTAPAV